MDFSIFNWTAPEATGSIPQVPHTFAYTLGTYGIQNEYQVSIGKPPVHLCMMCGFACAFCPFPVMHHLGLCLWVIIWVTLRRIATSALPDCAEWPDRCIPVCMSACRSLLLFVLVVCLVLVHALYLSRLVCMEISSKVRRFGAYGAHLRCAVCKAGHFFHFPLTHIAY